MTLKEKVYDVEKATVELTAYTPRKFIQ